MTRLIHLIYIAVLVAAAALPARAESADQAEGTLSLDALTEMADSAYMDDDYQQAADTYRHIINTYGASARLYYNLGNCYYRLDRPGQAVIAYERSLRLDPTDADTRYNLDFVNSRLADRPGERGTFIGNALDSIALSVKPDTWAWLAWGFFLLTAAGLLTYLFVSAVGIRKLGFFGGIATLLLFGVSLFLAHRASSITTATDRAVITAPSTILSTVPRQPSGRAQEAMLLHEGIKVTILDSVRVSSDSTHTMWYDVEVDNAHRAWINAAAVEKI